MQPFRDNCTPWRRVTYFEKLKSNPTMGSGSLVYREFPAKGRCMATIVALHGEGGDIEQMRSLVAILDPFYRVIVPVAWRPVNPHMPGPTDYRGYSCGFTN